MGPVMSSFLPPSIQKLIEEFSRLPGVGPKSAQRLAMHLLYSPEIRVQQLSDAVSGLKKGLSFCKRCWNITEGDLCRLCSDISRNQHQICVVEEVLDVVALEKTFEYKGVYHVLHGVLSPVDGIGPEQLKIQALEDRLKTILMEENSAKTGQQADDQLMAEHPAISKPKIEVILATNPSLEGETTAMYLMRLLKPMGISITRIARGLPAGGDLDYADELTLSKAMQGRQEYAS